jgi:ABC-type polysaccharide/polyol phosphate export permease
MSIAFDPPVAARAASAMRPGRAAADLMRGLRLWRTWLSLGWHDVRQRYKRSVLGPLWITLSMGITVAALGVLYARLFAQPIDTYLPFVALGFIVWGLISGLLLDACAVFVTAESYIRQIRLPLSFYVFRMVWRNLIVFAHNMLIFAVVVMLLPVDVGWHMLAALPGLLLVALTGLWAGLLVGMVCTRYRDVPQLVASVVQVSFFLTPIVWQPGQLARNTWVVEVNPFFHFVDIVRSPLLGSLPSVNSWSTAIAITVVGALVTFVVFARYRYRIAYWV